MPFRKFLVHKEIAQQFGAFHAQRMETVAVAPMTQGQGEMEFVKIKLCHFCRFVNNEIGSFIYLGKTKMNRRNDFLLPYFDLNFSICFLLYFRELQVIPTDNKAMRWRTVLVSDARSDGIIDEMTLVSVEAILA